MRTCRKALIVFVKEPVEGKVKTRLQVDLGPKKTVKVYKSFLNAILSECSSLRGVDRFLACDPSKDARYLKSLSVKYEMQRFNQQGENLHDRMFRVREKITLQC